MRYDGQIIIMKKKVIEKAKEITWFNHNVFKEYFKENNNLK